MIFLDFESAKKLKVNFLELKSTQKLKVIDFFYEKKVSLYITTLGQHWQKGGKSRSLESFISN